MCPFVAASIMRKKLLDHLRRLEAEGSVRGPITPQLFCGLDKRVSSHPELWRHMLQTVLPGTDLCPELISLCAQAPLDDAVDQILATLDANKRLVQLLERVLQINLSELMIESCVPWLEDMYDWPRVVQMLISMPSRVGNVMQKDLPAFCEQEKFSAVFCLNFGHALEFLARAEKEQVPWKVHQLVQLFSKMLTTYGGCESMEVFFKVTICACERDAFLRHVFRRILFHLEGKAAENALTLCLMQQPVGRLLGTKWPQQWKQQALTVLPLMRCHPRSNLPLSLVDTLAESLQEDLVDLVLQLASVWANKSAINHTSLDQQTYISEMLLRSAKHLKGLEGDKRVTLQKHIMSGVSKRLEQTSIEKRLVGMIVAEKLMPVCNPQAEPLKFEYNQSDLVNHLSKLKIKVEKLELHENWLETLEEQLDCEEAVFRSRLQNLNLESSRLEVSTVSQELVEQMVLDSDDEEDEFEAFDMSGDQQQDDQTPSFLREILQLILDHPEETSLAKLPKAIKEQLPDDDPAMALELLDALISLDSSSRDECMICVIETHPIESVQHLVGYLSVRNKLSGQQLGCILRNIAAAASSLFHGPEVPKPATLEVVPLPKNTRRIHSVRPAALERPSLFAPVASGFLLPLLPLLHLEWWGAEVRLHLLATLSVVTACSVHCPVVRKLSLALLEELEIASWPLRHEDGRLRAAALRCLLAALANLDVQGVYECVQRHEVRRHVQRMRTDDPDAECRDWAERACRLLL